MKIWLTRHGQTRLNKEKRMQGLTNEPLNETGIQQAKAARKRVGDVQFDAVYASPLDRAILTGSIIGNVPKEQIIVDPRLIETDFGKYEQRKYSHMGLRMWSYWALPEIIPAPKSVETIASMVERSSSFLKELEEKEYENVLVACHGGIMRALTGYLEERSNGIAWRPKPQNCEIRVFEVKDGKHRFVEQILEEK
ncbi:MAG: histidine phosphatase family protein [Eubacteriales bacterium]|nr:histidine phosphatase family protein [Eubacteriales bacterium]